LHFGGKINEYHSNYVLEAILLLHFQILRKAKYNGYFCVYLLK